MEAKTVLMPQMNWTVTTTFALKALSSVLTAHVFRWSLLTETPPSGNTCYILWHLQTHGKPFQEVKVCDGKSECGDGSDELCDDPCVPESHSGKRTMKVRPYLCCCLSCVLLLISLMANHMLYINLDSIWLTWFNSSQRFRSYHVFVLYYVLSVSTQHHLKVKLASETTAIQTNMKFRGQCFVYLVNRQFWHNEQTSKADKPWVMWSRPVDANLYKWAWDFNV